MDERDGAAVVRALWERFEARDWEGAQRLLADDLRIEWPGTRERIRGAEEYIGLNRTYPEGWHIEVLEVLQAGPRVVSRVRIDHGEAVVYASSFFTLKDGRIAEGVEYFADQVEPPYDRSRWAART